MNSDKEAKGFEEEPQPFDYSTLSARSSSSSRTLSATVGEGGRLVIPAELRKLMELSPGEGVALRVVDGVLHVVSATMAVKRVQAIATKLKKPGENVVDEFIADRLAEQRAVDARFDRLEREAREIAKEKERGKEPRN
jgi:AbrB family looped-hinge helix DNA binding protein